MQDVMKEQKGAVVETIRNNVMHKLTFFGAGLRFPRLFFFLHESGFGPYNVKAKSVPH